MRQRTYLYVAGILLTVGAVIGLSALAEDRTVADPSAGEYIGTFHPKKPGCASCHARATVSQEGAGYRLRVDVDYTSVKQACGGKTNRTFVLKGAFNGTNLVFANKRYEATVSGKALEGKRLSEGAAVPTVFQMKRKRVDRE